MRKLKLVEEAARPATAHSPVALTFDAEIKRYSVEQDRPIAEVMESLSKFTGITTTHLYNYRSGKTDIPAMLIPVFCRQFTSNALAMALIGMCDVDDFVEADQLGVTEFCSQVVRNHLAGGQVFLDAVRDGKIDGHELVEIKNVTARIVRDAHRVVEVATRMRERRVA